MDTQNQEINLLTDDDLERVNGGRNDEGAARAASNVSFVFGVIGNNNMSIYFAGMACAWGGWC
jgi:hypothetical protein